MKDHAICTVGASLYQNINRENLGKEARVFYEENRLSEIVKILRKLDDPLNNRSFGAEINSMASIVKQGIVEHRAALYLLVSDTPEGEKIGRILKDYFEENDHGLDFKSVHVVKVEGLNDKDEFTFRNKGLRNLVREMAKYARSSRERVVINATGGYKAQIAYAVALGQALGIPVCYRFERFNHMVVLPPLPVGLDQEVYNRNKLVFALLDAASELELSKFLKVGEWKSWSRVPEKMKLFLDRVHIDGKDYVALNPMGLIYAESVDWDYSVIDHPVFYSSRSPEEKLVGFEIHGQKVVQRTYKAIESLSKLPWINSLHLTGSSEKSSGNSFRVFVQDGCLKIEILTEKGALYMKAYCEYKSDRFLEAVRLKAEEVLSGKM
ncbi:putative CRISPR-associated protein [Thermotoga sp.]|uniref:putative CRISPR-associated protein n=1 Tax=Thermotoga sp. TaxID=28240 RepID=UPI0025D24929|nr:putative CRISPR-associated protein [Thermotoga sp.]MCD6550705.1 putative CRISPR-associated protein [Thermotoga sp.]